MNEEPTVPNTTVIVSPLVPGKQTSEYRLARNTAWVGDAMVVVGVLYEVLSSLGAVLPESKAVTIAIVVAGAALRLGSSLGYGVARSSLKKASLDQ